MKTGHLVFSNYTTTEPHEAISNVYDTLARDRFLVVKNQEKFIGILTLAEVNNKLYNLVKDCLLPKPKIDYNSDLEETVSCFEMLSYHVLPVFKDSDFYGVIRYKDIIQHLNEQNMDLAVHAEKIDRYESLRMLAAGVGHDFNNVLTAAIWQINMVFEQPSANNKIVEILKNVENGLWGAKELTQQLLTFSIDNAFSKERCDISTLAKRIVPFFIKNTTVEARFNFPENLAHAEGDIRQFSQVLANITLNAVQAMPYGGTLTIRGENIEITETSSKFLLPGVYLKLSVIDTGEGIAKENISRIFEPYITTKPGGRGLGLAIVYSIVRRHNGFIEVESEPGKGARFDIYLPAVI